VEARGIGIDQRIMSRKLSLPLNKHLGKRPAGVVLEMPLGRDNMRDEPFELALINDQLREEVPQIPVEEDTPDIENHAAANHAPSSRAKAPPEASDGVTLFIKGKRDASAPRRSISPGAP